MNQKMPKCLEVTLMLFFFIQEEQKFIKGVFLTAPSSSKQPHLAEHSTNPSIGS